MTSSETDHYVQSAEMYELLSEPHWMARRDSVRAALRSLEQVRGNVLDIGAGTGSCVQLIADTLPHASIFAVEPSASMRIGLMTRILLVPDLRRRVTVCAEPFQRAHLPERLDAVVACGCIGYFDREERAELWRRLAARLKPLGGVFTDVMALDRPQMFPETRIASAEVGAYRYDAWLKGYPGDGDLMRWQMRFDVRIGEETIRQFSIEREWHAFGIDQLIAEAAAAGFQGAPLADSPVPAVLLRLEE